MQATGIVAEYNPFHNGHLYHLQATKKITGQPVIVVMSGSLMQRGEPAFGNKWLRAQLAINQGVDLVVELPTAFSLRSAEFFARGAVQLLQATGCVNTLSCGVEHPQTDFLKLAEISFSIPFCQHLQQLIKQGLPYAAAQEQALQEFSGQKGLRSPNDILALEYTKALLDTDITPIYLKREASEYNDTKIQGQLASATAIRKAHGEGQLSNLAMAVPIEVYHSLTQKSWGYNQSLLWQLLSYRLRLLSAQEIAQSCQCSEGLENLLQTAADCSSLQEALEKCTSKRYPGSRIRRLLLQLLLQRPVASFAQQHPAYLRVLGFNNQGRQLLKEMKNTATLPVITKLGKNPTAGQPQSLQQQLDLDLAASNLLALLQTPPQRNNLDFYTSPYYPKK